MVSRNSDSEQDDLNLTKSLQKSFNFSSSKGFDNPSLKWKDGKLIILDDAEKKRLEKQKLDEEKDKMDREKAVTRLLWQKGVISQLGLSPPPVLSDTRLTTWRLLEDAPTFADAKIRPVRRTDRPEKQDGDEEEHHQFSHDQILYSQIYDYPSGVSANRWGSRAEGTKGVPSVDVIVARFRLGYLTHDWAEGEQPDDSDTTIQLYDQVLQGISALDDRAAGQPSSQSNASGKRPMRTPGFPKKKIRIIEDQESKTFIPTPADPRWDRFVFTVKNILAAMGHRDAIRELKKGDPKCLREYWRRFYFFLLEADDVIPHNTFLVLTNGLYKTESDGVTLTRLSETEETWNQARRWMWHALEACVNWAVDDYESEPRHCHRQMVVVRKRQGWYDTVEVTSDPYVHPYRRDVAMDKYGRPLPIARQPPKKASAVEVVE